MSWKPRNWNISRGLLYPWLPMWLSGKESSCQCGRCGFDPWVGKISWRRKWQTTPYSYLGNHMDRGDWWAIVHEFTKGWTGRSVDTCVCVCAHTHYIYLNLNPLFPGNIAKWLFSGSYLRPCDWVFWAIECRQCNVHNSHMGCLFHRNLSHNLPTSHFTHHREQNRRTRGTRDMFCMIPGFLFAFS